MQRTIWSDETTLVTTYIISVNYSFTSSPVVHQRVFLCIDISAADSGVGVSRLSREPVTQVQQ